MDSTSGSKASLQVTDSAHKRERRKEIRIQGYLTVMAVLAIVVPVGNCLLISGKRGIFRFLAGDTFFYLAVAKHRSWQPLFSFDGSLPTNGFHPLWQWVLKLISVTIEPDKMTLVVISFLICVGAVAASAALLTLSAYRLTRGMIVLALFSVVVGFVPLVAGFATPGTGMLASFVNGMESPLGLLFFSCLLLLLLSSNVLAPGPVRLLTIVTSSVLLTLVILARLDDVFLLPALGLVVLVRSADRSRAIVRLIQLLIIPITAIVIYMVINKVYVGTFLPASGAAKGGLSIGFNFHQMINTIIPLESFAHEEKFGSSWRELTYRNALMHVPALIALIYLVTDIFSLRWARNVDLRTLVMEVLAIYILFKWAYNFTFVHLWHQGDWYFPVSIIASNLLVAHRISTSIQRPVWRESTAFAACLGVLMFSIFLTNSVSSYRQQPIGGAPLFRLLNNGEKITQDLLRMDPKARIVSYDDGIVAYSLDLPVMSGFGFTLDREGLAAKKNDKLLDLAASRGYHYVTSLTYLSSYERQWLDGQGDYGRWRFEPVYEDAGSGLRVYAFSPRSRQHSSS